MPHPLSALRVLCLVVVLVVQLPGYAPALNAHAPQPPSAPAAPLPTAATPDPGPTDPASRAAATVPPVTPDPGPISTEAPVPTAPLTDTVAITSAEGGVWQSADGALTLAAPPGAVSRTAQLYILDQRELPASLAQLPLLFGFDLRDAVNDAPLNALNLPLTLTWRPADRSALAGLRLWRVDAAAQALRAVTSATVDVDGLTARLAGPGIYAATSAPPAETFFLPRIQAGQVDLFTGDASYAYDFDLPAGADGLNLPLTLRYSSGAPNTSGAGTVAETGGVTTVYVGNYYEWTASNAKRYYYAGAVRVAMRDNDAYLNRWIQPDTIVPDPYNPQSLNRYSYVLNNPLRYTDPSGHTQVCAEGDEGGGCGLGAGYAHVYELFRQKNSPLFEYYGMKVQLHEAIRSGVSEAEIEGIQGAMEGAYQRGSWWVGSATYDPVAIVDPGSTFRFAQAMTVVGGATVSRFIGNIYRSASGTKDSLTPRPGVDDVDPNGGLSFWDSADHPTIKPGSKYVEIDTAKLRELLAVHDNEPAGHVTVRPPTFGGLQEWAATRGTSVTHPYTQELFDAMTVKKK